MPETTPFDLPFNEAIAYFQAKGMTLSPEGWRQVWQDANARAFTVARVTSMDVLTDIRSEVQKALDAGISLGEFKRNLIPTLQKKGWFTPKGETPQVELPDGTIRKRLTPWRLETIYRTNLQSAYSVGRYQQMMDVAQDRPYWQYHAIMDSRTRPAHAAMDGKVYDHRHPIWNTWYPPNGFNCRCFVSTLSARQVAERGLKESTKGVDELPDEGWRYNVGEAPLKLGDDWLSGPYQEKPGQKTFRDFARPDIRDVAQEFRKESPAQMPTAKVAGFESSFAEALLVTGLDGAEKYRIIHTGDGEQALLNGMQLKHLYESGDGRERFIPYIIPTLEGPFEVYLTEYENRAGRTILRKRYIGLFEGAEKENYLVVLDLGRDGSVLWNDFVREKNKINGARVGILIYSENAPRL
jgi:SPP1 gp7 family putative phage head morphogenesis protein